MMLGDIKIFLNRKFSLEYVIIKYIYKSKKGVKESNLKNFIKQQQNLRLLQYSSILTHIDDVDEVYINLKDRYKYNNNYCIFTIKNDTIDLTHPVKNFINKMKVIRLKFLENES